MLFRIAHAQNQITKLFISPWKGCQCKELDSVETENAKTSTASLKRGKYIETESFW